MEVFVKDDAPRARGFVIQKVARSEDYPLLPSLLGIDHAVVNHVTLYTKDIWPRAIYLATESVPRDVTRAGRSPAPPPRLSAADRAR